MFYNKNSVNKLNSTSLSSCSVNCCNCWSWGSLRNTFLSTFILQAICLGYLSKTTGQFTIITGHCASRLLCQKSPTSWGQSKDMLGSYYINFVCFQFPNGHYIHLVKNKLCKITLKWCQWKPSPKKREQFSINYRTLHVYKLIKFNHPRGAGTPVYRLVWQNLCF